jgi:hypothetical protein
MEIILGIEEFLDFAHHLRQKVDVLLSLCEMMIGHILS